MAMESWPGLDGWGVDAFELVASGLCILRALTLQRGRSAVALLGIGLLSWTIGDLVLTVESAGGATPPTPSLADLFYLCFYPLTYVGLMLLVRRQIKRLRVATWLDGAIAGLGAAAVCAGICVPRHPALRGREHRLGGDQCRLSDRRSVAALWSLPGR